MRARLALLVLIVGTIGVAFVPKQATSAHPARDTFSVSLLGDDLHTNAIGFNFGCVQAWSATNAGWGPAAINCISGFIGDAGVRIYFSEPVELITVRFCAVEHVESSGDVGGGQWYYNDGSTPIVMSVNLCDGGDYGPSEILSSFGVEREIWHKTPYITELDFTYTTLSDAVVCYGPTPSPTCGPPPPPPGPSGECSACTYSPVGDWFVDAPKLVAWLMCQILNVWGCQALPILMFMWGVLLSIMHLIAWSRLWFAAEFTIFGNWLNYNILAVAYFLGQTITNIGIEISQAIFWSNGANTTIISGGGGSFWDVLIALINALGTAIGNLTSGIGTALGALPGAIAGVLESLFSNLANVIIAILSLLNTILNFVFTLIMIGITLVFAAGQIIGDVLLSVVNIIPEIVSTFIAGLNSSYSVGLGVGTFGTGTPSPGSVPGTLDCTNPTIFHVCLALYVLDNTIVQTPTGGTGPSVIGVTILIGLGVCFINVLIWAIRRFQKLGSS